MSLQIACVGAGDSWFWVCWMSGSAERARGERQDHKNQTHENQVGGGWTAPQIVVNCYSDEFTFSGIAACVIAPYLENE